MSATRFGLLIHLEDESVQEVTADQRDMAAFERVEKIGTTQAMENMPMVYFRALGYFAQRRTGAIATSVSREDWESRVIEVEPAPDGPEPVDPTSREAPAAT